jgi:hypothetical protein
MKLIVREYLASLRERDELDALLPDLLSQMGLDVFAKPSRGALEYGVDIAAYGRIGNGPAKVYLFSVKSGDIDRHCWETSGEQALRTSLNSILDSYIPCRLPPQYKDDPIEICICFGGSIKTNVRQDITGYLKRNATANISFSEWGGDRLAIFIEEYFLREDLLRDQNRTLLRKSIAMLDDPEVSYFHFRELIRQLSEHEGQSSGSVLTAIRQLYLSLWILYAWCREADNLESAYRCGELVLLNAWETGKGHFEKRDKCSKAIVETLNSIQVLHVQISRNFLDTKIIPHTNKLHAISHAVRSSCALYVNLKLFDLLGRLSLTGLWIYWMLLEEIERPEVNEDVVADLMHSLEQYQESVAQLISNNPMLHAPYKDEQAIEIGITAVFLSLDPKKHQDLYDWIRLIIQQTNFALVFNYAYPCNLKNYYELLEHPSAKDIETYRKEVTKGSVLYPLISYVSALHGLDDIYSLIQKIKTKFLKHCNFQIWFPWEDSEAHFYRNDKNHGATFCDFSVGEEPIVLMDIVQRECQASKEFNSLSAIEKGRGPLVLLACRHYRLPIPFHFFVPHEDGSS